MAKMKQRNDIHCVMTVKGLFCENTFIFTTGRIKRMRNPKKMQDYFRGKSIRLKAVKDKFKIWDLLWQQNQEFIYPITRWNKH